MQASGAGHELGVEAINADLDYKLAIAHPDSVTVPAGQPQQPALQQLGLVGPVPGALSEAAEDVPAAMASAGGCVYEPK